MNYSKIVLFGFAVIMIVVLIISMTRLGSLPGDEATPTPPGGQTPAAVGGYSTHTDASAGFAIQYPESWVAVPQAARPENVVAGFWDDSDCGGFRSSFIVGTEEVSAVTLGDYGAALREQCTAVEGCTFVAEQELTVGGVEAIEQTYTLVDGGITVQRKQVVLLDGSTAWLVLCDAAESCWGWYEPVFDTVVGSFELVP